MKPMKKIIIYICTILPVSSLMLFLSCSDDENNSIQAEFEASVNEVMAGEKVVFNDLSAGNVSAWNWTFEGGTPSTSQLSQPEVVYDTPGQYSVTLEVRNKDGAASLTKEAFITVGYSSLTANFTSNTVNAMNDTPVTFTDLSTGIATAWKWTFTSTTGDIVTSTEQHPSITFTAPGLYSVKLEVSNPEYSDTKTVENYLTVIDAFNVIADFTAYSRYTYQGAEVLFTDKSVGRITSWLWTFEGPVAFTATDQNPSIVFPQEGVYKVSLKASNGSIDNTITREDYITVIPSADLSAMFTFDGVIRDEVSAAVTAKVQQLGTISLDASNRRNIAGHAASFDGSGGFIVKDDPAFNLGTGDFTISVWLKILEAQKTVRMVAWQESGAGGSGDNQTWLRHYSTATNHLTFATEDAAGGSTIHLTEANSPAVNNIANGQWRHVVCVRAGLTTSIYVDGTLARSVNATVIKDVSNAGDFKVGCQESGVGKYINPFIGFIDDLLIYKRALTDQEVATLYGY